MKRNVADVVCTDLQLDMSTLPPTKCALVNGKFVLVNKHSLFVRTSVINHDFRGRVKVVMQNLSDKDYVLKRGTKIAKPMFVNTQENLNERVFVNSQEKSNDGVFGGWWINNVKFCIVITKSAVCVEKKFYLCLST